MIRVGDLETTYTATGLPRYALEIWHDGLNQYRVIKGDNPYVVKQKAQAVLNQWEEKWARKKATDQRKAQQQRMARQKSENKEQAAEQTQEAQGALKELEDVLAATLHIDDTIDWETLKNDADFPTPKPSRPTPHPRPAPPRIPPQPKASDPKYQPQLGFLDNLIPSRRQAKEKEAEQLFKYARAVWFEEKESQLAIFEAKEIEHKRALAQQEEQYEADVAAWEKEQAEYLEQREQSNAAIDEKRAQYLQGDPEAVLDYCDLVLSRSSYPDYFPQSYELDYNRETGILVVDYQLPAVESLPTLKEVTYVQSKDEFREKHISASQLNALYDSLVYQIVLRTIHELFEADQVDALVAVVINGYVRSIDRATGQEQNACILSLQASKDEFMGINLENVDPKACFKSMKGVGSSKLHSMTPVAPIMWIDRQDKRFVASYDVAHTLDEGYNLATMDWEDFEHLVRELFEKEFSETGGEVKVTQASRDGGIDAVVFDPDPIRGGKIVIQAKRYTNTVGVSAVRDLYGTVLNEGANKGILVTTSDFGPDAYTFANGKPLVLLSGSNLLHLLEKHGHKARINLAEARKNAGSS